MMVKLSKRATIWLEAVILAAIVISSGVLKLLHLGERAFSFNESIYALTAKHFVTEGFDWQFERMAGTAHPPLQFYITGWFWKIGLWLTPNTTEEAAFRVATVIMSCLIVLFIYGICRRYGKIVALSGASLFAFHPYVFFYSRLNEMDMPLLFWVTFGTFLFIEWIYCQKPGFKAIFLLAMSGVLFGLAAMTKIYGIVALIPAIISLIIVAIFSKTSFKAAFMYVIVLIGSCTGTVILMPLFLFKMPLLYYESIRELLNSFSSIVPLLATSGGTQVSSFFRNVPPLAVKVLISLQKGWGAGVLVISLLGIIGLWKESRYNKGAVSFILAFLITFYSFLLYFHFLRYLLILASVIPIFFAFGIKELIKVAGQTMSPVRAKFLGRHLRLPNASLSVLIFLTTLYAISPIAQIPRIYKVKVVADTVYGDYIKEAALFISDRIPAGDWVLSNSLFLVLTYYGGFPTHLYMGFKPYLILSKIYQEDLKGPAVVPVSWNEEQHLKFVVVDRTNLYLTNEDYLLEKQAELYFGEVSSALLEYLLNYFHPVASFGPNKEVTVYERVSRNLHTPTDEPEIWVGEGGAEWKKDIPNFNGWIFGNGWGKPQSLMEGSEVFWSRTAQRDDKGFADFILDLKDIDRDTTLEVLYQDTGVGEVTVATILARQSSTGESQRLLQPLGKIKLTNSSTLKTERFSLLTPWYYDVSLDGPGHQQHFALLTAGQPLPVIKLSISQ